MYQRQLISIHCCHKSTLNVLSLDKFGGTAMTKHLYMKIADILDGRISDQIYKPDSLFPTEQNLQTEFDVSRATIRNAMKVLVEKDLIHRIRGDGTYVKSGKTQHDALTHTGFTEEVEQQGNKASTRILGFQLQEAEEYEASKLNIIPGEIVYFIKRLRMINDIPELLEYSYMPFELFPDLSVETIQNSKYEYVEQKLGLKIKHSKENLFAENLQAEDAKPLQAKVGKPILCVESIGVLEDDTIFDFSVNKFILKQYAFGYTSERSKVLGSA